MRWHHDRGFSLVEAMVAMSISTIVVMGGMAAIQLSARLVQQGTIKTRALALAQGAWKQSGPCGGRRFCRMISTTMAGWM